MARNGEIYRSARQLLEEEGEGAVEAARTMTNHMLLIGNGEAAHVWRSIREAVEEMLDRR